MSERNKNPRIIGVIPARYASTRLPGKMLADINGQPMVVWVAQGAAKSGVFDRLLIATDHEKIAEVVRAAGYEAVMTDSALSSGTARVAEVAKNIEGDVFINVQGDDPLVDTDGLKTLSAAFDNPEVKMATLAFPLHKRDEDNPNAVKVVLDSKANALYFSRSLIPYPRSKDGFAPLKHIGVYAYRRDILLRLVELAPCDIEINESLEQLRALYYGIPIKVLFATQETLSVDTFDDLERVRAFIGRRN
ncbi:MAG: 3-deoxy-manno-octulosonate cytidylyltransferase [Candidatus Riflebacteria bacterium]|nr:3-deoxy-manno-octulosonate cytidylyltransferase [Candidatus Riflebacteria bacterium]